MENEADMKRALDFYGRYSSKVEIYKNNALHLHYFIILPYCAFTSKDYQKEFLDGVNRTNCKTKCENLARSSNLLTIALKQDYWLRYSLQGLLGLFVESLVTWKDYMVMIAIIINVIILISFNNEKHDRATEPSLGSLNSDDVETIIFAFGIWNMFGVIIVTMTHFVIRIPYNYQKALQIRQASAINKFMNTSVPIERGLG